MRAFSVVRFRVSPGSKQKFIDADREVRERLARVRGDALLETGERTFRTIGGASARRIRCRARSWSIPVGR